MQIENCKDLDLLKKMLEVAKIHKTRLADEFGNTNDYQSKGIYNRILEIDMEILKIKLRIEELQVGKKYEK